MITYVVNLTCIVMAYVVLACIVMAYTAVAYVLLASIVMAYIVMALVQRLARLSSEGLSPFDQEVADLVDHLRP